MTRLLSALLLALCLASVGIAQEQPDAPKALTSDVAVKALTLALEDARDQLTLRRIQEQLQERARARAEKMAALEKEAGCPIEWNATPDHCRPIPKETK